MLAMFEPQHTPTPLDTPPYLRTHYAHSFLLFPVGGISMGAAPAWTLASP